jgi:hypothetical protein
VHLIRQLWATLRKRAFHCFCILFTGGVMGSKSGKPMMSQTTTHVSVLGRCWVPCRRRVLSSIQALHILRSEFKIVQISILFDARNGDRFRKRREALFSISGIFKSALVCVLTICRLQRSKIWAPVLLYFFAKLCRTDSFIRCPLTRGE